MRTSASPPAIRPVLAEKPRQILRRGTGRRHRRLENKFDSIGKELRDVLTRGEVISKVDDVQCAIESGDPSSVEAIRVIGQAGAGMGAQGNPPPVDYPW